MTPCPQCHRLVEVPLNVVTAVVACPWCRHQFATSGPTHPVVAAPAPFDVTALSAPPAAVPAPPPQPGNVVLEGRSGQAVSPLAVLALVSSGLFVVCLGFLVAIPVALLGLFRLMLGGKMFSTWHWKVEVHSNRPGASFPNPAGPGEIIEGKKPKTLPPLT